MTAEITGFRFRFEERAAIETDTARVSVNGQTRFATTAGGYVCANDQRPLWSWFG
jgi:hypothetical protein